MTKFELESLDIDLTFGFCYLAFFHNTHKRLTTVAQKHLFDIIYSHLLCL